MTITLDGTNGVTTAGITLGSTAIASTGAELNILDGVTATATELNLIDGVTSTTAELNILDGVTSTAAELNILDGVTATAAELNLIDGGTARGTTAVADGDGFLTNDGGTMRMTKVDTLATYMGTKISGHWSNIAEVALGASNVAAIQITLPAGYDLHRLDIRFPRTQGSTAKALFMEVPRDGSSQSNFSYATTSLMDATHEGAKNRLEDTFTMSPVGGAAVGDNLFYSITFSDWRSSSRLSSWSGHGHQWKQSDNSMWIIRSTGFDYGSADDTSSFEVHTGVNFTLTGGANFKTMTGCYYRLYGHNYS